jgi:uncharacterized protein
MSVRPKRAFRRKPAAENIRLMVNRIKRQFKPERIILFGSHARGEATPDSDIDLLVVMPTKDRIGTEISIRKALYGIRVPKDIIVTTPEDFHWRKDTVGTIEYPAVLEGKLLYVRS